ncbi:MAG: succinate dehydrogenase [Methylobacterium sp.]|nr:MAG: succinate dehydrogenase [Methylobacterium sp.]
MSAGTQTALPRRGARRAVRPRAGFAAALLHRLSGIALALFLPMHFIALGTALQGADRLESFLGLTHNGFVRTAEWGLVSALALHMVLGLRVLVLEWFVARERTALVVSACVAAGLAVGLLFLLGGA